MHTCYKVGRPDALAEVSIFPTAALEYCGFSRSQRSSVQHVIRALSQQREQPPVVQQSAGAAAAGPAEGADSTGQQATEGTAATEVDVQIAAPDASSADASSATASEAAVDMVEASEAFAATDALGGDDASATDPVSTGLETDASVTSRPAAEVLQGALLQPIDRGSTRKRCQPSRQPFQLQFHPGARADGMLSHRQYGGASSCCYEGRQDCMSRRDVTFSRRGSRSLMIYAYSGS